MHSYTPNNLEHIKDIFEEKTGVVLTPKRPCFKIRSALILAAVLGCLTVSTMAAQGIFSVLDGDDLALSSTYEGDGVITVLVENKSDKPLKFQPQLRLSRWTTSEVIEPLSDNISFDNTTVPARSTQTMTIDLSDAYDIKTLEDPLTDDWYYLTLTNNNFIFGQDWFCSVDFAENAHTPIEYPEQPQPDAAVLSRIQERLRPYFEKSSVDVQDRRVGEAAYVQNYTELLADLKDTIVSPVSPVLPGNRINIEEPYLTVGPPADGIIFDDSIPAGEQAKLTWQNWFARDGYFKLICRQQEYALQLSAVLASENGQSDALVPMLYVLTYEKADAVDDAYAFIYGQLLTFEQMEEYKVYEDDTYVCYEVSPLMYSDFMTYAEEYVNTCTSVQWNEAGKQRLMNIYQYYKENLNALFVYR